MAHYDSYHTLCQQLRTELNNERDRGLDLQFRYAALEGRFKTLLSTTTGLRADVADREQQLEALSKLNVKNSTEAPELRETVLDLQQQLDAAVAKSEDFERRAVAAEADRDDVVNRCKLSLDVAEQQLIAKNKELEQATKNAEDTTELWKMLNGADDRMDQLEKEKVATNKKVVSLTNQLQAANKEAGRKQAPKRKMTEKEMAYGNHQSDDDDEEDLSLFSIKTENIGSSNSSTSSTRPGIFSSSYKPKGAEVPTYVTPSTESPFATTSTNQATGKWAFQRSNQTSLSTSRPTLKRQRTTRAITNHNKEELQFLGPVQQLHTRVRASQTLSDAEVATGYGFEFEMVTGYAGGGQFFSHGSKEMSDRLEDLWDKIARLTEGWMENKGDMWHSGYEDNKKAIARRHCIAQKFEKKTTAWSAGDDGKHACRDCVKEGRPCFTWTGEEFHLLPLHDEDRVRPVEEGFEIRNWMNL